MSSMDRESEILLHETSQSVEVSQINTILDDRIDQQETHSCILCRRMFSSDSVEHGLESVEICGDCNFMLLEDLDTTMRDSHRTRPCRGRRTSRYSSSESIEDLFSSHVSQFMNVVRQNASEHETQASDDAARLLQLTSSQTTPNRSRRWQFTISDNESEGFDDSFYGETDSVASFAGGYGTFHGDNDTVSYGAYGGESDASVDGISLLDREIVIQLDHESYLDSDVDTDIDPMHAGLHHWNSDHEDGVWEEANEEGNTVEAVEGQGLLQEAIRRAPNSPLNWLRGLQSPENRNVNRFGIQEIRRLTFTNMEESPFTGNSDDYLDTGGFEELLEQLAETESSRRGAPPAAVSFINSSLPRVIVTEEHERCHGGLICAVCKETISVGAEVNQLPCTHLYHPSCILPWLSMRNSCPLCRFELPTDDKDYEEGKRNNAQVRMVGLNIEEEDSPSAEDSSDEDCLEVYNLSNVRVEQGDVLTENCDTGSPSREEGRGNWLFLAAAPIATLVGIVLVLWFQNPLAEGRRMPNQQGHVSSFVSSVGHNQRDNRNRRWWSFF